MALPCTRCHGDPRPQMRWGTIVLHLMLLRLKAMGCLVLRGLQLYHRLKMCKNKGPRGQEASSAKAV